MELSSLLWQRSRDYMKHEQARLTSLADKLPPAGPGTQATNRTEYVMEADRLGLKLKTWDKPIRDALRSVKPPLTKEELRAFAQEREIIHDNELLPLMRLQADTLGER